MPVLQGRTPGDLVRCALGVADWRTLVAVHLFGYPSLRDLLAVLAALESVLPAHTSVHLIGIVPSLQSQLGGHLRLVVDDVGNRVDALGVECRLGRWLAFWIGHVEAWADKQPRRASRAFGAKGVEPVGCGQ